MSEDTGLQDLRAQLDAIASALAADDLAGAGAGAAAYDIALRDYLEACAPGHAPVDALREMLSMQNRLLLRMAETQKGIAGKLREVHRAGRASRAYAAEMER